MWLQLSCQLGLQGLLPQWLTHLAGKFVLVVS